MLSLTGAQAPNQGDVLLVLAPLLLFAIVLFHHAWHLELKCTITATSSCTEANYGIIHKWLILMERTPSDLRVYGRGKLMRSYIWPDGFAFPVLEPWETLKPKSPLSIRTVINNPISSTPEYYYIGSVEANTFSKEKANDRIEMMIIWMCLLISKKSVSGRSLRTCQIVTHRT